MIGRKRKTAGRRPFFTHPLFCLLSVFFLTTAITAAAPAPTELRLSVNEPLTVQLALGRAGDRVDGLSFMEPMTSAILDTKKASVLYDPTNRGDTVQAFGAPGPSHGVFLAARIAHGLGATARQQLSRRLRARRSVAAGLREAPARHPLSATALSLTAPAMRQRP
jgi:hypothetical protein